MSRSLPTCPRPEPCRSHLAMAASTGVALVLNFIDRRAKMRAQVRLRVLTEPLELCECGCGLQIDPRRDPSPFFKAYNCQNLWMASQSRPAHLQAAWRRRQRRWFYMVNQCADWDSPVDWFLVDAVYVACYAQGLLSFFMPSRNWRRPTVFDSERIIGDYCSHLIGKHGSWCPPDWAVRRYGKPYLQYGPLWPSQPQP